MHSREPTETYRRRENQAVESLRQLAEGLETSGRFDLALDCAESLVALRENDPGRASAMLTRIRELSCHPDEWSEDSSQVLDLVLCRLAGLNEYLLTEESVSRKPG